MTSVRADALQLDDVIQDPATTLHPCPDGTSLVVRIVSWRDGEPGRIGFDYEVMPGQPLAGLIDWADYAPEVELTLISRGA